MVKQISEAQPSQVSWMHSISEMAHSVSNKIYKFGQPLFDRLYAIFDFVYPKNPITGYRELWYLPTSLEILLGSSLYYSTCSSQGGELLDAAMQQRIKGIVANIAQFGQRPGYTFEYEATVLDSNKLNAWAMSGGKLAFYKGLIDKVDDFDLSEWKGLTKDDVLAAVIGHEVAHSAIGHTRKRLEKTLLLQLGLFVGKIATSIFINNKELQAARDAEREHDIGRRVEKRQELQRYEMYRTLASIGFDFFAKFALDLYMLFDSRGAEFEADKYGIKLAHQAGYDVRGALALQKLFIAEKGHSHQSDSWLGKGLELLSTHPTSEKRLEKNQETVATILSGHGSYKKA